MKLTAKVKLSPTQAQAATLKETMLVANKACNYISQQAWTRKTFGQYKLQKLLYNEVKNTFISPVTIGDIRGRGKPMCISVNLSTQT